MPWIVDPHAREVAKLHKPVDLANITNRNRPDNTETAGANKPSREKFGELLKLLEAEALKNGYDSVYVEQIMNQFLPEVLD